MSYEAVAPLPVRSDVPIDVIGEAIESIKRELGVPVCPADEYVDRARPENSPIHGTLTWDDAVLAERARREQARLIIRVVVRTSSTDELQTWRNVHITVRSDDGELVEGGASVADVAPRSDLRQQVLRELLARVRGDVENHGWLTETQPILNAIKDVERVYLSEHAPLMPV